MNRYANILLLSMAAVVLLLSGTFWQSTGDSPHKSVSVFPVSLSGSIGAAFSSLAQCKSVEIVAADEDSDDSKGDEKDGKDGKDDEDSAMKDLWDSVLLG